MNMEPTKCACCEEMTVRPVTIQIVVSAGANCTIAICPECEADAEKGSGRPKGLLLEAIKHLLVDGIQRLVGII